MSEKNISCFFTGHRSIAREEYVTIKEQLKKEIIHLIENYGVKNFCAGGALGFDTLAAQTVLELKKEYDIRLILYIPCLNQSEKWTDRDKEIYNTIKQSCDYYHVISGTYTKDCMLARNRRMADACLYGICYKRKNSGGTAYTVNYAKNIGAKLIML